MPKKKENVSRITEVAITNASSECTKKNAAEWPPSHDWVYHFVQGGVIK